MRNQIQIVTLALVVALASACGKDAPAPGGGEQGATSAPTELVIRNEGESSRPAQDNTFGRKEGLKAGDQQEYTYSARESFGFRIRMNGSVTKDSDACDPNRVKMRFRWYAPSDERRNADSAITKDLGLDDEIGDIQAEAGKSYILETTLIDSGQCEVLGVSFSAVRPAESSETRPQD